MKHENYFITVMNVTKMNERKSQYVGIFGSNPTDSN